MALPFDNLNDIGARFFLSIKESTAVPGQPGVVVLGPDGGPLSVSLAAGDIEIGAVEIKNGNTDDRASVDASGRLLTRITDTNGATIANGQKTMANSVPIVIASDQTPIPVSLSGSAVSLTPLSGQPVVLAGPTQAPLGVGQVDQLVIIAKLGNAGKIYLGPTGVTSANGLELEQGRDVTLTSVDLATIFINGTAGDGVSWFALT